MDAERQSDEGTKKPSDKERNSKPNSDSMKGNRTGLHFP
jgi:hypothetical protein